MTNECVGSSGHHFLSMMSVLTDLYIFLLSCHYLLIMLTVSLAFSDCSRLGRRPALTNSQQELLSLGGGELGCSLCSWNVWILLCVSPFPTSHVSSSPNQLQMTSCHPILGWSKISALIKIYRQRARGESPSWKSKPKIPKSRIQKKGNLASGLSLKSYAIYNQTFRQLLYCQLIHILEMITHESARKNIKY